MKNPLDSLWGTIICGLILTVLFYVLAHAIVVNSAKAGA